MAILIRSTTPETVEILFAWWNRDPLGTFSVALALTLKGVVFTLLREELIRARHLLLWGVFYAVFVVAVPISVLRVRRPPVGAGMASSLRAARGGRSRRPIA